jgi:hypothetical protein
MALTARDIEILEWNINRLNERIANMIFYNVPQKKIEKATAQRDRYQEQLDQG